MNLLLVIGVIKEYIMYETNYFFNLWLFCKLLFFFSVKFDHMPDLLNYGDILFHLLYYIEMYILFALGEAEIHVNV